MRVLVACEFSGVVRDAFHRAGHPDTWSCDLLPSDSLFHHQGDAVEFMRSSQWDLMIAHPPCTAVCVSGNRWYSGTPEREAGVAFVQMFMDSDIPKIAIENPVGVLSTYIRKPDQTIQPWQFGHGETKATCLWLKSLPLLMPTNIVAGRESRIHKMPPSIDRGRLRSITYQGIADAMANQWGSL